MQRTICLLGLLLLSGCVTAKQVEQRVVQQASFDHDCPEREIQVVTRDETIWAYNLEVCGKKRKYRDIGSATYFQFVDVTDGTPLPPR
jgi:hypothetical protein